MLARVSNIEAYRQWKNWSPLFDGQEEPTVEDLIRFITVDEPSAAMLAGTAFHKAIETADYGDHAELTANGYRFIMLSAEIDAPAVRELRAYRQYGSLTVTGQVDGIEGKVVIDHKTTGRCDAERYLNGCQWKFYLDLFGANEFRWNIFEIKELEEKVYRVSAPQILTAYRYPEMHDHCAALAADFYGFASQHMREAA